MLRAAARWVSDPPPQRNLGGLANDLALYESARTRGRLRIRVYCAVPIKDVAAAVSRGAGGDQWLRWGAVKGYVDGSLGSLTAAFLEPYSDHSKGEGYCGDLVNSPADLERWITAADAADLQVCVCVCVRAYERRTCAPTVQVFIHAIGDRAVRVILDVFERVAAANGPKDRRWRVEHAQHIAAVDIPRFARLGVWASVQPSHAADDGRWCERAIGRARAQAGTYAFRSLLGAGARLAGGSDWFVAVPSPVAGIAAFVTRATLPYADTREARRDAASRVAFVPGEAISVEAALRAYTVDAAASVHEEGEKGRLAAGLLADIVMLDTDLFTCAPAEIEDARVLLTVLGGAVVYDREAELCAAHGDSEVARIGRAVQRGLPRCPCCH